MEDAESTLQEYEIQLEQVDLALQADADNEELLKLKLDLLEVIGLTKDLIREEEDNERNERAKRQKTSSETQQLQNQKEGTPEKERSWSPGDKCMAMYRVDDKYYSARVEKIMDDGSGACSVVFDGYSKSENTLVSLLKPHDKSNSSMTSPEKKAAAAASAMAAAANVNKKPFSKKEMDLRLREMKKVKKEKYAQKIKAQEEVSEKGKNKWKSFNSKLSSKTWKGVVKKNKYETSDDHESKIGVGTNSASNRLKSAAGTLLPQPNTSSAQLSTLLTNFKKK